MKARDDQGVNYFKGYFHFKLVIILYKVVLNFESVNVAHKCVTKGFDQHLSVVLFIMLHKVVLPFKGDNLNLICDPSNTSCPVVVHVAVCFR